MYIEFFLNILLGNFLIELLQLGFVFIELQLIYVLLNKQI